MKLTYYNLKDFYFLNSIYIYPKKVTVKDNGNTQYLLKL